MKYVELKSFIRRARNKSMSADWDTPLFDDSAYNRIVKNFDRDFDRMWALVGGRPEETASA